MDMNETTYEHVSGDPIFRVTASERWSIAMVNRLKAARPDEVTIEHINPDGSMVVTFPFDWMRIVPKKRLADNQQRGNAENLRLYREKKAKTQENSEDASNYPPEIC